ncbi:MAG TPA: sterol desaturase family protein [Caulobacteraceae bacterium]|jgi:sterol desaturase/sphingolipid hydroxylase (fatty acid hydroxylase superfamily)
MAFLTSFVSDLTPGTVQLFLTCLSFLALETLWPRAGSRVTAAARLKAMVFWVVNGAAAVLIGDALAPIWRPTGFHPLLPSLAPAGLPAPLAGAIGVVAAAFVGDFFYYWCHRAQHRVPWLWRFHAVHHSVREMNGLTGYHHFTEGFIEFALYALPLSLFTDSPYAIPFLGLALAWQGNYEHSPTRVHLGPLRRLLVDNRIHRIHHSLERRHYDKNFGIFTTLWDQLFGTAWFPADDEWPQTGVADFPEPQSVRELLIAPFVWRAGSAAPMATVPVPPAE